MFDEHQHSHAHGHGHEHDCAHDHGHEHDPVIAEAPLDPANQSLADALRASFRVLKLVMMVVVVLFLFSGVFIVDEKEVVVLSRFGQRVDPVRRPGLHWAFPYPIDDKVRVATAPKTLKVEDFWLRIREDQKHKRLDELSPNASGLDPAVDGALLTADRAIMHASFSVLYRIVEAKASEFVQNVRDEETLIRTVIKEAAVAEAVRTPAEVIWRDPAQLATAVQARAEKMLEDLKTGIKIENVSSPESHYPLQTAGEFLAVSNAENQRRGLINEAQTERHKKLNGMAGPAWETINKEIEKLDQVKEEAERKQIIARIGDLLMTEATGEAGGKIKLAQRDREKIVDETLAEVSQFDALREEYKRNPELVRLRLTQRMRDELFAHKGVSKWILPPDDKQVVLWINKDPKEIAAEEKARMEEAARKRR